MNTPNNRLAAIATALLLTSGGAHATVVFDNGGPLDGGPTAASDLAPFTPDGLRQEAADDFTLASAATLNGINWWGAYTPANQVDAVPDDFTIRVLDSAFNLIAAINVGTVSRFDTGLDNLLGLDIYGYETSVAPLTLAAGQYFLSILNNTPGDLPGQRWSWQGTAGTTGTIGQFRRDLVPFPDTTTGWLDASTDYAFNITAVPAPGALVLLVIGLFGASVARARKR